MTNTTTLEALHENIKRRRESLELSQAELATRCGVAPATISHCETGRREPSISLFLGLCRALHCGPTELAGSVASPVPVKCPKCDGKGVCYPDDPEAT